jgi:hypothetical protein
MVETVDNFVAVKARWRPPSGALREPRPASGPIPDRRRSGDRHLTVAGRRRARRVRSSGGRDAREPRHRRSPGRHAAAPRRCGRPHPAGRRRDLLHDRGERGTKRAQPFGPSADSVRGFRRRWLRGGEATDIGGELAVACSLVHGEVMRDATESGLSRGGAVEVALRPRGPSRRLSNAVLPLPPRSGGRGSG